MMKIISVITLLCSTLLSRGQLFQKKNFMPGIKTVKVKYFSGTGGKGFWSEEKLDSLGRIIEKSRYRKDKLTERTVYDYNSRNDIIARITVYNINFPIDTSRYEYLYTNNIISFEKRINSSHDSVVNRLIYNEGDSILTYRETSYTYIADRKEYYNTSRTYTLHCKDNLLTKLEIVNSKEEKEIVEYTYYRNGNLKRSVIKRIPEPEYKIGYTGGPGSDDQSYRYTYRQGRVKALYTIANNRTYKIATYRYEK